MAKSSPELVEAYKMIKAGQRQEAAQVLKSYLGENKHDAQAWWLMAHAVGKPDHVRRCLETVLKLDPDHAQARARLEQITTRASAPPVPHRPASPLPPRPAAAPPIPGVASSAPPPAPARPPSSSVVEEPDDSLFFGSSSAGTAAGTAAGAAASAASAPAPAVDAPPPPAPSPAPSSRPPIPRPKSQPAPSFDEFAASAPDSADPFSASTVDDPFAGIPSGNGDPFAPVAAGVPGNVSSSAPPIPGTAPGTAPGTGSQPGWGPGLGFVTEDGLDPAANGGSNSGSNRGFGEDFTAQARKSGLESAIGYTLIAVAVVVLIGLGLYVAVNGFSSGDSGGKVPAMTQLDGGSFTIDYPGGWDTECVRESLGYMVCGVANHPYYNEAQWYATEEIDLGDMIGEAFSMALTGSNLPDEQVSIIVMDVPTNSPSYDNGSWAKTSYENVEMMREWGFVSDSADINYTKNEITVDGLAAYYYEYSSDDPEAQRDGWWGHEAAYDVYVPHDGIMLWMRVDIRSDIGDANYHNMIQAMIESIDLKPPEQW